MLFRLRALLTDEAVPSGQNMEVLSITAVISRGEIIEIMQVKTCGAFSCIGIACYKHMKATEVCQEGMAYCKLWRSVTQVTWNQYVTMWTAGCAPRCGPWEPCSAFSGYRCQQECCEARAVSCLRLDGSVGTAAAGAGSRSYAPLMMPALMCVTSQLIGRLLS
ncbi:unnamed protein product [Merluccius merluccius]